MATALLVSLAPFRSLESVAFLARLEQLHPKLLPHPPQAVFPVALVNIQTLLDQKPAPPAPPINAPP